MCEIFVDAKSLWNVCRPHTICEIIYKPQTEGEISVDIIIYEI